jgi:hypothetical protein
VRLNKETGKCVVKCDICGIYISLTSNDHTIRLINHRRNTECEKARKGVDVAAREGSFILKRFLSNEKGQGEVFPKLQIPPGSHLLQNEEDVV